MIIAIEGGDQAGKKTQADMLADALKSQNVKTSMFSFPDYGTPIGKEISKYLAGQREFPAQVIHCLMAANRWEKLNEIRDAISNSTIIMNRYYHSNLVYGIVNGLEQNWVENLDVGLPKADLVILLDISLEESFSRKRERRDVFENDKKFLGQILETYRSIAKKNSWKIVDATRPKDVIHQDIMRLMMKYEEKIS